MSALDIDLGVTNQKRTGNIDLVFSRGVHDHPGRGLAVGGMLAGNIWTEISRVDQTISKLAQKLRFNGKVLLHCKQPTADAALVRDDDEFEPIRFQAPQGLWHAWKNPYLLRIGTINAVLHDRAVAIDKDGRRQRITHVRYPLGNWR